MIRQNTAVGWVFGIVLGLIFVSISTMLIVVSSIHKTQITIGGATLLARVAKTDQELSHGLSGTSDLKDSQGMLFVFGYADKWTIWMKDMKYPIDVIWLDKDKKVIDVAVNLTPDSYPQSFKPNQNALYVLEVPSGFITRHNIVSGTKASFKL
ncbi:MAG TPA: DUF192 domain-containing protein [Patescibacteria group bacterium]|jgi:uncharacterized membrane protein (UPF0127 family)|nr:DUF192 domain-containing protein [Patescibacteria group bacterium]